MVQGAVVTGPANLEVTVLATFKDIKTEQVPLR